jgi:tRNA threonylcarbamoyladenosine biosynthesis protein TsaB
MKSGQHTQAAVTGKMPAMKLLAIDTTETACSAALFNEGAVTSRYELAPRQHSALILPMMEGLLNVAGLKLADLDGLAFARGPGSFTGLRISAGVIQGVAVGADLPVVPVSSLLALAQRALREHDARHVLAAFDARMNEVYWLPAAADAHGLMQPLADEQVTAPDGVTMPAGDNWLGVGSGWATYHDALAAVAGDALAGTLPELTVHAHDVAVLGAAGLAAGQGVSAAQALPVYLRDKVATKPKAPVL